MTSTETYMSSSSREEQLYGSVKKSLENRKYSWQGIRTPTTNSLKELLITNSVEIEATTDTNITALCTLDTEPVDSVESFERLCQFCEDLAPTHKTELGQILYPVFVHVYLDLIAGGHSGVAESFLDKFSMVINSTNKGEMQELSEIVSAEQVSGSSLAKKFRQQKFFLRMSSKAFQLLMQFLQVCQTPGLLSLIQRYLVIDVYGPAPVSTAEGPGKPEQKKGVNSLMFVKPKIPQLEMPQVSMHRELKMPDFNKVVSSKFGRITDAGLMTADCAPSTFTIASSDDHSSSSSRVELRERLAVCSQQLTPSPPSLSLYTVHAHHSNHIHCASLSASSNNYACGFTDSSVHLWSRLPEETSHTTHSRSIRSSDHHILRGHRGPVYGLKFDSSGRYLLSCSEDCSVRLWDTHGPHSLVSYRGHSYPVWDVTFSPVDVYFATASLDRTARLWTTDLVYPLRILAGHTASLNVVRFHCNGKYVATGSYDRTCRLWDVQTGSCVRLFSGNKSPIVSLSFTPNGKQLVSGDVSGTVRVWDLGSGGVVNEYSEALPTSKRCPISSIAFSTDNTLLATSSHDNHISVRNLKSIERSNLTTQQLLSKDVISRHKCDVDQILHLNFTHRNCLVAVGSARTHSGTSSRMDIS